MKKVRIILTLTAFVCAVAGSFATLLPVAETQGKPTRATQVACDAVSPDTLFETTCYINGSGSQCHLSDGSTLAFRTTNCTTVLRINP